MSSYSLFCFAILLSYENFLFPLELKDTVVHENFVTKIVLVVYHYFKIHHVVCMTVNHMVSMVLVKKIILFLFHLDCQTHYSAWIYSSPFENMLLFGMD